MDKIVAAAIHCGEYTAVSPLLACAAIAAPLSHGDFAANLQTAIDHPWK